MSQGCDDAGQLSSWCYWNMLRSSKQLGPTCAGVEIPVVVQTYNNPTLVGKLVRQLRQCFNASIVLFDAGSTFPGMISLLDSFDADPRVSVIRAGNVGPRGLFQEHQSQTLGNLPRFFAYTDGDMALNEATPPNFLCVMAHLTQRLKRAKVGLALDIGDPWRMWQVPYFGTQTVWEWEDQFWQHHLTAGEDWPAMDGILFDAGVDTTFAVYDKAQARCTGEQQVPGYVCFSIGSAARVGGPFTAKHIPWYPDGLIGWPEGELEAAFGGKGTVANMIRAHGVSASAGSQENKMNMLWRAANPVGGFGGCSSLQASMTVPRGVPLLFPVRGSGFTYR